MYDARCALALLWLFLCINIAQASSIPSVLLPSLSINDFTGNKKPS